MRRRLLRAWRVVVVIVTVGAGVGVIEVAPAAAATAITTPSTNPFTISLDAGGNALPFDVVVSGFQPQQNVYIEICDGMASTSAGWNPGTHCDLTTSPTAVPASASGTASFPATNPNEQIGDFNGVSPGDLFNCLSAAQITAFGDATPGPAPGEYILGSGDVATATGQTVDPGQPAWTNCQLRTSSNNSFVTSDQVFDTLTIPASGPADSVSLGSSPSSPQTIGTPITLTATVTPTGSTATLTGTLSFTAAPSGGAATTVCSGVAPSPGTCQWTPTAPGTYTLVATYSGDAVYPTESSPSTVSYTITAMVPSDTVSLQANPASPQNVGTPITLTASVTPTGSTAPLTGNLTFTATSGGSSTIVCQSVSLTSGSGSCTWTPTTAASYTLVASYGNDPVYPSASSPSISYTIEILQTGPTITEPAQNPFTISLDGNGNALPFDVVSTGWTPKTNVVIEICDGTPPTTPGWSPAEFCDNTTSPSAVAADSHGTASFPATNPNEQIVDFNGVSPGDKFNCLSLAEIQAFGDATAGSLAGEYTLGPNDTTTATMQTVDPGVRAWTNCQLRVSSNNSFVTSDQQFLTLTIPGLGSHSITESLGEAQASPQPADTPITLTASVTPGAGEPAATGSVTFLDGGIPISQSCTNIPIATPTCTWTPLVAGTHQLTVEYNGDTFYAASTSPAVSYTITPLTSSLHLSYSPSSGIVQGQIVTLTATASGGGPIPTGSVEFTSDGAPIIGCESEPIGLTGRAVCETTLLPPGVDVLASSYGGDKTYSKATSNTSDVTVSPPPPPVRRTPTLLLSVDPPSAGVGQRFSLLLSVYGAGPAGPTGTVAFHRDGAAISGCTRIALRGGLAVCTTSVAIAGIFRFTASYSGDSLYLPATSTAKAFRISGAPQTGGYWMAAADGGIFQFGDARFFGSLGSVRLNRPIVAMAATPDGGGYWLVASDGGVFPFGDAHFYGSLGSIRLNKPIVAVAATADGRGYWLVASDGGVFPFGDARFFGSLGSVRLNQPIVAVAAAPAGGGYWLVASDGGVFPFGAARFHGSLGSVRLNAPIVGMAATPDGGGYWLVASDGGVFPMGNAPFHGSAGAGALSAPVVAIAADGTAYRLFGADGRVYDYGGAPDFGDDGGMPLSQPVVAGATAP